MKISTFATNLLIALSIMVPMSVSAASATATSSTQLPVANVYIHNATIVNRSANSVSVFFGIGNGAGSQPDVHYGLQLFKVEQNGSQVLADQYISSDTLSLTAGAPMMGHTLTYTAPAFFSGAYQVWVIAENSNGFPYSAVPAGSVTFTPSVRGYVEILYPTCLLSVVGDATHAQYTPQQGVDILPNETLVATCQVTNHFPSKEVIIPQFETRYRSEFGTIVPLPSPSGATTALTANKTQTLTFALPTAPAPQAYNLHLEFVDNTGSVISNSVTFHYVVAGPSGTIQNATLDKNWYGVGDTAHATIAWTPSADSFAGSRYGSTTTQMLVLEAVLSSASSSIPCGAPVTMQVPAAGPSANLSIPLTATCVNPSLLVSLKDTNGNLLDQKTFTVSSPTPATPYKTIVAVIATIVAILVLYGVAHTVYTKRHARSLV